MFDFKTLIQLQLYSLNNETIKFEIESARAQTLAKFRNKLKAAKNKKFR